MATGHDQQRHWQSVHSAHPNMYGWQPSEPARYAAEAFRVEDARSILELGSGHGRDAPHFASEGFVVRATDFSAAGLDQLRFRAKRY